MQKVSTDPIIRKVGMVDVTFGTGVTVVEPVNLYGCTIGDSSFIGPFVEIQSGVAIWKRCRIQSHAFICEYVTIGDECFTSHGAMFINDLLPLGCRRKDGANFGGQPRLVIGLASVRMPQFCQSQSVNHVVVGAGAVVSKDIIEPSIYAGNPARLLRHF